MQSERITTQEIWKLRFRHSISVLELTQEVRDLMQKGLEETEAIQAAVEAVRIGDFQTLGEAYRCRKRLIQLVTTELKRKR